MELRFNLNASSKIIEKFYLSLYPSAFVHHGLFFCFVKKYMSVWKNKAVDQGSKNAQPAGLSLSYSQHRRAMGWDHVGSKHFNDLFGPVPGHSISF